jgi:hypothetical protein
MYNYTLQSHLLTELDIFGSICTSTRTAVRIVKLVVVYPTCEMLILLFLLFLLYTYQYQISV